MRPRTITVGSSKGGSGKSTLALNLAAAAACAGRRALLVDADPQGTAALFAAARPTDRPAFRTVRATTDVDREVARLAPTFDVVVVDAPGADSRAFRAAVLAAEVVLAPVRPAAADLWRAEDFLAAVARLGDAAPRVALVLCQVPARSRLAEEAARNLATIARRHRARLLEVRIGLRTLWAESGGEGMAVTELESHSLAADELRQLVDELHLWKG